MFIDLLKQKPVNKITINEICQSLHINRSTFYRHFEDIYFLLEEIEQDFIKDLSQLYKSISISDLSSIDTMKVILQFVKDNKQLYILFMLEHKNSLLQEKTNELSNELFLAKIYQKYPASLSCDKYELLRAVEFVSNGFYGLYRSWLLEDCKENIDQLASRLSILSDNTIEFVVKNY